MCAGGPERRLASKATEMWVLSSAQRRPVPPSALRRADPTRPLCVRVLDSTGKETNGRRYTGQQLATKSARGPACQPLFLFLHRFTLDFLRSCLRMRRDVQNICLRYSGGLEGRLPSGPTEMSAPWIAQRRPAPASAVCSADPTARCVSEFWTRQVGGVEEVGWLGAGSLHWAAPSREWLPQESASFERAYNLPLKKNMFSINF